MKESYFLKSIKLSAVLCVIFIFTTCQTVSTVLQEPVISLHSVELAKVNFKDAQILCKVQIQNPNIFEIPLPEIGWEIFLNANSFISGVVKNNQRISARNSSIVEIPVSFEYLDVFRTFSSLIGTKSIEYKIPLALKFSIPVLGDKIWRLEPQGVLPLPQAPKLSAPSIRIVKTDLTMVELAVSVNVENPNAFILPAPKIAFNYLINNTSILRNSFENRSQLAASSVTPVVFGLAVYYTDVFRILPNLVTANSASTLLDMSVDFGIPVFSGQPFNLQIPGTIPLTGR
jgi:LEA14-like dessication related protein